MAVRRVAVAAVVMMLASVQFAAPISAQETEVPEFFMGYVGFASDNENRFWGVRGDGNIYSMEPGQGPYSYELLADLGDLGLALPIVAATGTQDGFLVAGGDGGVFAMFGAPYFGSVPELDVDLASPISDIEATPSGQGYWLVGRDGGVFAFGDAPFLGSLPMAGVTPTGNVVDIVPTETGLGYWLLDEAGGVFTFGDAPFLGSVPGIGGAKDTIVAMAAGLDGYWILERLGPTTRFGTDVFYGEYGPPHYEPAAIVDVLENGLGGYTIGLSGGRVITFGPRPPCERVSVPVDDNCVN